MLRFVFRVTPKFMSASNEKVTPKKRGRPATGKDPHLTFRAPPELVVKVDAFASGEGLTKSEAIRRLVEKGLDA